jgi:hypothetical protein
MKNGAALGHRMKKPATFFILWHKNESERAFMNLHD